jgi:hypothetical protein
MLSRARARVVEHRCCPVRQQARAYRCAYKLVSATRNLLQLDATENRRECSLFLLPATSFILFRWTFNPKVVGSIPTRPIGKCLDHGIFCFAVGVYPAFVLTDDETALVRRVFQSTFLKVRYSRSSNLRSCATGAGCSARTRSVDVLLASRSGGASRTVRRLRR